MDQLPLERFENSRVELLRDLKIVE
jgi:hypothetical protein